jgi:excisionase family DNA binding protein
MANPKELTAIEAARRLGVGLDYLYSLLWTGKLEGYKVGRNWRISAEKVEARRKRQSNDVR